MRAFIYWLQGWTQTIDLYLHNRPLYDQLKSGRFDPQDYEEVGKPR